MRLKLRRSPRMKASFRLWLASNYKKRERLKNLVYVPEIWYNSSVRKDSKYFY